MVLSSGGFAMDSKYDHITLNEQQLATFRTTVCERHRQGCCFVADKCCNSHCQTWQRRNPNEYSYLPKLCPDIEFVKKGSKMTLVRRCCRGRACTFAHSKEEELYHPSMYKTKLCNACPNCTRYYCPFAHDEGERRKVSCVTPGLNRGPRNSVTSSSSGMPSSTASTVDDINIHKQQRKPSNMKKKHSKHCPASPISSSTCASNAPPAATPPLLPLIETPGVINDDLTLPLVDPRNSRTMNISQNETSNSSYMDLSQTAGLQQLNAILALAAQCPAPINPTTIQQESAGEWQQNTPAFLEADDFFNGSWSPNGYRTAFAPEATNLSINGARGYSSSKAQDSTFLDGRAELAQLTEQFMGSGISPSSQIPEGISATVLNQQWENKNANRIPKNFHDKGGKDFALSDTDFIEALVAAAERPELLRRIVSGLQKTFKQQCEQEPGQLSDTDLETLQQFFPGVQTTNGAVSGSSTPPSVSSFSSAEYARQEKCLGKENQTHYHYHENPHQQVSMGNRCQNANARLMPMGYTSLNQPTYFYQASPSPLEKEDYFSVAPSAAATTEVSGFLNQRIGRDSESMTNTPSTNWDFSPAAAEDPATVAASVRASDHSAEQALLLLSLMGTSTANWENGKAANLNGRTDNTRWGFRPVGMIDNNSC